MSGRLAVATLPVVDVRRSPSHRAELSSQLLMGEPVRILEGTERSQWLRVRCLEDDYEGWARSWGLANEGAQDWLRAARHQVRRLWVTATDGAQGGSAVTSLLWRSRVAVVARRGGRACLRLPDGRTCWLAASDLRTRGARGRALVPVARSLLGLPYLWGGRTVQGFDCSGLVQQVLAEVGMRLPRDARDQWRSCRPLPSSHQPSPGDLLFFARPGRRISHVGLALDRGYLIHAVGRVRLAHVHPDNPLYDKALFRIYRGSGRPRRRLGRWGLSGQKVIDNGAGRT